MSMKSKIVTAAATLTLVAGVGAAGTLTANAATSACGNNCVNWFSAAYGTAAHPAFVLNVLNQVGQGRPAGHPGRGQRGEPGGGLPGGERGPGQ